LGLSGWKGRCHRYATSRKSPAREQLDWGGEAGMVLATRDIALGNEILRGVVGSTAHGTAIESQDDRDEMGVFVEPPECVCGLTPCDHYIYRDQPEGVRSQAGDLDLTMYSLRKFCRLAAQGNPSVILLLWLPVHICKEPIGAELVTMRNAFVSKQSGERFLGYLAAQKMRLTGERTRSVNRPELVAKYGYDTKFAMHDSLRKFCRLAAQGNPSVILLLWLPVHICFAAWL
jgi:predicted nucleotidyltransferase